MMVRITEKLQNARVYGQTKRHWKNAGRPYRQFLKSGLLRILKIR